MDIRTVFSISQHAYQLWQAELLAYTHRRVGQPGTITCLVSTNELPRPVLPSTFHTQAWSPHPVTGDDYAPYNKPFALSTWLREAPPPETTVLVLDPDCVFLSRIELTARRGAPVAHPSPYMNAAEHSSVLRRYNL